MAGNAMQAKNHSSKSSSGLKWKPLAVSIGFKSGAFATLNRVWSSRLTILTYHRVADPFDPSFRGLATNISATPAAFEAQLDLLRQWFNVVSLDTLLDWLRGDGDLPPRAALITFDDGYRDNLTAALPALKARGLPAVIFVTTGQIGGTRPFWWDHAAYCIAKTECTEAELPLIGRQGFGGWDARVALTQAWCSAASRIPAERVGPVIEQLAERLDVQVDAGTFAGVYLDWDEVRRMATNGFDLGAHTVNHPALAQVSDARAREEATASKTRLEAETGRPIRAFAYPHGSSDHFGEQHERILAEEGYLTAFSTLSGPQSSSSARQAPMRIRRIHISLRDDLPRFAGKLVGGARIEAMRGGE